MRRIIGNDSKLCCIVSNQQLSTADPTPQSWLLELNALAFTNPAALPRKKSKPGRKQRKHQSLS